MKLGPALKLRSVLAKKLGGPCPCVSCVTQIQQMLSLQSGNMIAAPPSDTNINVSITENNRHLHKKSLTITNDNNYSSNKTDSSKNNCVNQDKRATGLVSVIPMNTTAELHLSDSNIIRSGTNCITDINNLSLPPSQQSPQQRNQEQTLPQDICNNNENTIINNISSNNDNLTINRPDNIDSRS